MSLLNPKKKLKDILKQTTFFVNLLIRFDSSPYSLSQFLFYVLLALWLVCAAQTLEKVKFSLTLRNVFFSQKVVIIFENSLFWQNPNFLKSPWPKNGNSIPLHNQTLCNKTTSYAVCYYKPSRSKMEKETKILKNGARGDRQGLTYPKWKCSTSYFKRASIHFSRMRSYGDINNWKF